MSQAQSASGSESAETLAKTAVDQPDLQEGEAEGPSAAVAAWPSRPMRRSATWRLFVQKRDGQL
jgi:hypothetical protein